jgi:hypothetical protein
MHLICILRWVYFCIPKEILQLWDHSRQCRNKRCQFNCVSVPRIDWFPCLCHDQVVLSNRKHGVEAFINGDLEDVGRELALRFDIAFQIRQFILLH